ncbi:MAG TPA: condensation domain-containing protein, partial [Actinophytocola sp.]|nr:condensation domain-containing protein [Actinophytocola sp.]
VGVESTFFELGGHSLTAIRLLNRVRAELGRTVPVLDFLRAPTIRQLAARLEAADPVPEQPHRPAPVDPPSQQDPRVERSAPASVNQARQYRLTKAADHPSVVTIAQRFTLRGSLDVEALRAALSALVARHPALRTRYAEQGRVQQVLVPEPVELPELAATESTVDDLGREWSVRPFDLDDEPAFRPALLHVGPGHAELVLALHHGISDGMSMITIIRDLGELYRARVTGDQPDLPELTADFVDFTDWEREHLNDPATTEAVRAWAAEVRPYREIPVLPTDHPRAEQRTNAGAIWSTKLPAELSEELTTFAARHGTTPFAVTFAAFAWLLHELTGTSNAVVRCGVANRQEPRFEHVVGMFTHTSWLIAPLHGASTFADLLPRASDALWHRLALQAVPGDVLNEALGAPYDQNPPRVIFSMFDQPMPLLTLPGVAPAEPTDVELAGARVDQTWLLGALADGGLELVVEYTVELFDESTVAGWADRFLTLLRRALANPDTPLNPSGTPISE